MVDSANCGTCGNKCDIGEFCIGGSCIKDSKTTITYCNGIRMDGQFNIAEKAGFNYYLFSSLFASMSSDSANCGQCERKCNTGHVCFSGDCMTLDQASSYYSVLQSYGITRGATICDNQLINITIDSANCGQCGNKCEIGEICKSGECEMGTGYTNCDGTGIDISNDSTNCGRCGNKCDVGEICRLGKCENGTGETYCDGARVDTSNDTANCGQCGNKCSVDEECMSGRCV